MKKEVCGKIYKTMDYDVFRMIDANRDPKTWKRVRDSIHRVGWISDPILVNERYEIIDGQNRFLACRDLGIPIEFVVQEGIGVDEARSLNIGRTNWKPHDWVHSYAEDGYQGYQYLRELEKRWKGTVALPGLTWCTDPVCSTGSQAGAYTKLSQGTFDMNVRQYNYVNMALEKLSDLKLLYYAKAYKINAKTWIPSMFYAYMHPDVNMDRLSKQVWKHPELIPSCTSTVEQLARISKAYNVNLAKKRNVHLDTDYEREEYLDIKQAIIRGGK